MFKPKTLIVAALGCAVLSPFISSHPARAEVRRDDFRIEADLIQAATDGDSIRVRDLLSKGAKVETRDPQTTWTPLMWAARGGHVAAVKLLLARGARVNARSVGSAAAYISLAYGRQRAKSVASESATAAATTAAAPSVFASANNGITPLILASSGGFNLAAKLLLDKGADVNAQTSSGESALEAAAFKGYLPLVQTLLARGARVNIVNGQNQTPLVNAVLEGHSPVVKVLLGRGADPNATYQRGRYSALALARYFGYTDIARSLQRAGARSTVAQTKTAVEKRPQPMPAPRSRPAARRGAPAAGGSGIIILN